MKLIDILLAVVRSPSVVAAFGALQREARKNSIEEAEVVSIGMLKTAEDLRAQLRERYG